MRNGCTYQIRFYRKKRSSQWTLSSLNTQHCNHPTASRYSTYASHRRATPEQHELITQLIDSGSTDQQIVQVLNSHNRNCSSDCEGHGAFVSKDIANMRTRFSGVSISSNNSIKRFINSMESRGYTFRLRTDDNNKFVALYFTHERMIQRARQLSDVIIIDATYKTNKYKMPFVNMVGVSNLGRDFKSLANFPIAGAWISSENKASYQWVMEQLEATVFPEGSSWRPGVTVTDQDQALMNAIDNVFPDAGNILCNLHIGRNFKKNIGPFVDEPEEKWMEIKKAL
ncbi:hypothetical protein [Absidia glauca]|uniref:MULE transposase domain-containing protein n=1 Tax=Absidia glauca TaxID=4829 RepID=A0A163JH70_ABSGL|nr:hypothetical protein [Absidia glauca]